jgi:hypothetical protein
MTKINRTKGTDKLCCLSFCPIAFGHCIVCPFVLFILVIVLSVLLSYLFWSLYCLSFCPIYFGHCIVCPFVLFHLVIVLSVLLSYLFWSLCCLSFCPISFGHCIVCPFVLFLLEDKRTDNTMTNRNRTKGQTTQ